MSWHWEHFKPWEVLSPNGIELFEKTGLLLFQPLALDQLERLRAEIISKGLGETVRVNYPDHPHRGYRSPDENKKVHGQPHSLHLQGLAADVTVPGLSVHKLAEVAESVGYTGIGIYAERNFCHLDLRTNLETKVTVFDGSRYEQ